MAMPPPRVTAAPEVAEARPTQDGDAARAITALVAQAGVVAAGLHMWLAKGINIATVAAVVTVPLWWPVLRRYRSMPTLMILTPLALGWGVVLAMLSSSGHSIDSNNSVIFIGSVVAGVAAVVLCLWARDFVSVHQVALLFGVGALMGVVLRGGSTWKFDLSVPVTFIVLGLVGRSRNRLIPAGAVIALGLYGVTQDSRSYFAFCLVAGLLTVWQGFLRPSDPTASRARRWLPALLLALLGFAIYTSLTFLMTNGYFGAELQQRSTQQIQSTGSLIAGGRPEWAATKQLVILTPQGYGIGVVPSWHDVQAGEFGLSTINVVGDAKRTEYMFVGAFELHSIAANLWASCGWAGLVLAGFVIYCLARNLTFLLAARSASTIVIFSSALALWSMLFGPLYTDWLPVCAALGLSMLPIGSERTVESVT
jgi:hypothetical protein